MKKTNAKAAVAVIVVPENAALESSEKMPPSDVACKCELTIYAKVASPADDADDADDDPVNDDEKIAKKLMDDWTRDCACNECGSSSRMSNMDGINRRGNGKLL